MRVINPVNNLITLLLLRVIDGCLHFRYNSTVNFHPAFLNLFATLYRRCRKALKQILNYSESRSKGKGKTPNEAEI